MSAGQLLTSRTARRVHAGVCTLHLRIMRCLRTALCGSRALSTNSSSMRAVFVGDDQKPHVRTTPRPVPAADERLLRVLAAGVNRADLLQCAGKYPSPMGASPVLGLEVAGVLDDGTPACALLPGGSFAEYAAVPNYAFLKLSPRTLENLPPAELAAIPEAFVAAYHILFQLGGFEAGQSVLIHAGASGVGTALIQLARQVPGAVVLASAGTPGKRDLCSSLGADVVVDYKADARAVSSAVLGRTAGRGVDLVLDCVGPAAFKENVRSVRTDGTWVLYGLLSGAKSPELGLAGLLTKRVRLLSTTLRGRSADFKARLIAEFSQRHAEDFENGRLRPVLAKMFNGLSAVSDALEYMQSNRNAGKIAINVAPHIV